ncbi:MAG: hypothetical protein HS108_02955 [Planctomycetes bacterium]|jgi:hypothetical protein|nr:hypothetical protein [Planctomycetota bacterium]MCL4730119.1 hypothetical protein [Planctomycetota bacterium]
MADTALVPAARASASAPHREARDLLRSALKPDPDLLRVGPDRRILWRLVPLVLVPFAGAAVLALHPPLWPQDPDDSRQWVDPVCFGAAALGVAVLFAWGCLRVVGRYAASRPDNPRDALIEFYRAAQHHPTRLALLALAQPRPESPRPVFHWLLAGAVPALDHGRAFTRYWLALLRGNPAVTRRLRVLDLGVTIVRPDVAVAGLTLRVRSLRRARAIAAWVPALGVALAPFALGPEWVRAAGAPFWAAVWGCLALAAATLVLAWHLGGVRAESRDVPLRKVLVRNGRNWRLLFGQFEAAAEADLSWLE